jgi:hypothetical protein
MKFFDASEDPWFDIRDIKVLNKNILLSRKPYYIEFYNRMKNEIETRFIVSLREVRKDHFDNLLYYIKTASRIDVNLQGVFLAEFLDVTKNFGKKADSHLVKPGIKNNSGDSRFQSILFWEINQIYWTKKLISKTYWHYMNSSLSKDDLKKVGIEANYIKP